MSDDADTHQAIPDLAKPAVELAGGKPRVALCFRKIAIFKERHSGNEREFVGQSRNEGGERKRELQVLLGVADGRLIGVNQFAKRGVSVVAGRLIA